MTTTDTAARDKVAVAQFTCRSAGCKKPAGTQCIYTSGKNKGKPCPPHPLREAMADAWLMRQHELDEEAAQVESLTKQLTADGVERDTLTQQRNSALAQVTDLQAQLNALQHPDPVEPADLPGWTLDMAEDFAKLDTKIWTSWSGIHMGGHAEAAIAANTTVVEEAVRADPDDKAKQVTAKGVLRMVAKREPTKASDGTTQAYSSGAIYSQGKYTLPNYFRIAVRCAIPWGQGLWPAPLWLRPDDQAGAAEIDLIEAIGREANLLHYTIHAGANYGADHVQAGSSQTLASPAGWIERVLEKVKNTLIISDIDGNEITRRSRGDGKIPTAKWDAAYEVADRRWAIWSNLQLGGSWAGAPDATTPVPAEMLVDYIHTWVPKAA